MSIYEHFAHIYSVGDYADFSRHMALQLPDVLSRLDARPRTILDLACGDGTFAVAAARQGIKVTGLDRSPEMLRLAARKSAEARVSVGLVQGDMRCFAFGSAFDLVTCWFDSLNYLLEPAELQNTLECAHRALAPGGLLIFDMNTIHGLVINVQQCPCYVQQDRPDLFTVHQAEYDFETNIATLRITGFFSSQGIWKRVDEEHRERGYTQEEIRTYLEDAGFQVIACWGSFKEMSEAGPDSPRIWCVARMVPDASA